MMRDAIPNEELGNAVSHGLGCLLALAALPLLRSELVAQATLRQAGVAVFALTMLAMFVASALYHAATAGEAKQRLRRLDHAAIFLFIAGSATPFVLGRAEAMVNWTLLAAIWSVAAVGIAMKLTGRLRAPLASTALYLAFGWLAAAAGWPAIAEMAPRAQTFLVGGGLAYTVGCAFYLLGWRVRQAHLAWHLFVLVGCASHLAALFSAGS
jgi:hemolysin III